VSAMRTRPFNRLRVICDRSLTVANLVDRAAAAHDDMPLVHFDRAVPYGELADRIGPRQLLGFVARMGRLLIERCRLDRYERVAIIKANGGDYVVNGLAIIRAGGITVPIHSGMSSPITRDYLIYTGARLLITDVSSYRRLSDYLPETLRHVLVTDFDGDAASDLARDPRVVPLGPALSEVASEPLPPADLGNDDDVLICHTSGTTGVPKGVLHTNGSLLAGIRSSLLVQPIFRSDLVVMASPSNHFICHLSLMTALLGQLRTWQVDDEPRALLDLIDRERISVVWCFPHTYLAMYEHGLDKHDLSSVRMWLAAADASHEQHIQAFVKRGAFLRLFGHPVLRSTFLDTLGTSEAGFLALCNVILARAGRYGRCVGWPLLGVGLKVKVANEVGRRLPPGQIGRLMIKGPTMFKGYWNAHHTLHGVKRDGWWWTGDLAYRDRLGRFYHVDRVGDVIHTGRGDAFSLAIEEWLLKYPNVIEAVVVGRDVDDGVQEPIAFVQPIASCAIDADAMLRWANAQLSPRERLAEIRVVPREEIPRGLTGKALKRALRERIAHESRHTTLTSTVAAALVGQRESVSC
jgi:3-aminoavenalumate diazotase